MRASRWHRSARGRCASLRSRCPTPARRQYNRRQWQITDGPRRHGDTEVFCRSQMLRASVLRGACVAACDRIIGLTFTRKPIPKRSPIARRRGFGRCRRSPIGSPRRRAPCSAICASSSSIARSSRQRSSRPRRELARVTIARDNAAEHAEGARGDARRARRPASRSGSSSCRSAAAPATCSCCSPPTTCARMGRMARGVAAVAELDRVRLETHRRTLAAERDGAQRARAATRRGRRRCRSDAARARAAVEAAVAARNRLIDDLDQRRDLAAQFVAELQQAQAAARADASPPPTRRRRSSALPIRPFQGDLPWPVDGKVASRFGRVSRQAVSARPSSEMASRWRRPKGTAATAVHEGTVAYAAPFSGFGTLVIVDHGNSAFTLYGHLLEAAVSAGTNVSRGTPLGQRRACRRPAEPPCISRSASTAARSTRYNGCEARGRSWRSEMRRSR